MKLKEYRIPIPLTLEEYRLGQQWTELELHKESVQASSTSITVNDHFNEQERLKIIQEKLPSSLQTQVTSGTVLTHKKYHINDQTPKFLEFILVKSKNNLILEEYSWNSWPCTLTIIENLDYCIRIIIQSYHMNMNLSSKMATNHFSFSLNDEQRKYLKDYEIINIAERVDEKTAYRLDEDPSKVTSRKKPNLLPLRLNSRWYDTWPSYQPSMCVYKLVELIIFDEKNDEKSFLTRATNKILWSSIMKTQKMLFHRFHQKMICHIDRWIDKTPEDIHEEEKLWRKFLCQQQKQFVDVKK